VDRELREYFRRAGRERTVAPGDRAGPFLTRVVERLPDQPATVFSWSGAVLWQTRPSVALFGAHTTADGSPLRPVDRWMTDPAARERHLVEVGATGRPHLRWFRHVELGDLELYRQLLVDREDHQLLLVFTAVPGSPSDEKIRRLTARKG
jgi:hypothetical protein